MRTLPVAAMMGLLGVAMVMGGCANKELDEAHARNRDMVTARDNALAALEQMRDENRKLQGEKQQLDAIIVGLRTQLDAMEKSKAGLLASLDDLKRQLADARGKVIVSPIGAVNALPDDLTAALEAFAKEFPGLLSFDPRTGMVKFKSDMTFAPGSDEVNADAKAALVKLAEILNSPKAAPFKIYIAGHTDDIPIVQEATKRRHPTNWYLSVHRAVSVEEVMAGASVDETRLAAVGFGPYQPVAENAANHKGNQANRRVEIWIVPPERFITMTGAKTVEEPKTEKK